MSLPDAQKAVSDKPPKFSVAAPNVKAEQNKDVDRKLRAYGVIQAFRNGRLPDNMQIDETLRYVRDHSPIDTAQLSPEGRTLIEDVRKIIETARRFVNEKNAGEVIQQFLFHTSGAQLEKKKLAVDAPISEREAKQDVKEALEHLRTLFQLLVTNSETRKLLSDFKLIGRSIFADAASTIADRARPAREELDQVDEATHTNKFDHGEPGFSGPSISTPNGATSDAGPSDVPIHTLDEEPVITEAATTASKEEKVAPAKKTLKSRIQGISGRVPEKHKQRANADLERSKNYLKKQFPKERRDQFMYRLKKVVVECQAHPSYQASLSWFLSELETYYGHGKRIASAGTNQKASFFADPMLDQAVSEMRTFLESCANGQGMEGMFSAAQKMWEDAQDDEELRAWWSRVSTFARKSLLEPGFILTPLFETQTRQLHDKSRKFFDVKYKEHCDELVDSIQGWFRAWSEDPLNKRLGADSSQLIKDLLFDTESKLTFKPHLWADIRHVILPTFIEKVGYVPIPRIEYTDEDFDIVIENLTLQGRNLFPKILEINVQNYVKLSPYKEIRDEHHHTITVALSQIQADMRDVAFFYRKKRGLRISDSGLTDVFVGGKGISIKIKLSSSTKDRAGGASLFKVKDVLVKVGTLKFAIRDSKHDLLYRTVRPLASSLIKKQISKAITDTIRTGLEYADGQLVEVRDRMAAADASEDGSKTQVLKDMWSNRKSDASSEKGSTKASKRQSQFRIVAQRDSMLLPEQGHETGWIRKQAKLDAAAATGEGWKSKAFSIVPTAT